MLADRGGPIPHADLDVLVPLLFALHPAVDLEHQLVFLDIQLRDLDQITDPGCRTEFLPRIIPLRLIVLAIRIDMEGFLRSRDDHLRGREFRSQTT